MAAPSAEATVSYCLHCGKPWATHGTVCDTPLTRSALPGVQPDSGPPVAQRCSQCEALRAQLLEARSDIDHLLPAMRAAAHARDRALAERDRLASEHAALRSQLSDARSALARIRNVATAAHAPLAACLDWCANEDVLALDLTAPAPSRTSADVPGTPLP
jgi:hypothetical protein